MLYKTVTRGGYGFFITRGILQKNRQNRILNAINERKVENRKIMSYYEGEKIISGGKDMSRLTIMSSRTSPQVTRDLYADLERRIFDGSADFCPVDMTVSFLKMCHAQTCGKCVPCRIGLGQLQRLLERVLDGEATLSVIDLIKRTVESIYASADCEIGYEAAGVVLRGMHKFYDDYEEHILSGRCICNRRHKGAEGEEERHDQDRD